MWKKGIEQCIKENQNIKEENCLFCVFFLLHTVFLFFFLCKSFKSAVLSVGIVYMLIKIFAFNKLYYQQHQRKYQQKLMQLSLTVFQSFSSFCTALSLCYAKKPSREIYVFLIFPTTLFISRNKRKNIAIKTKRCYSKNL